MAKLRSFQHLAKLNIIKYLAVLITASFFLTLLHGVLALFSGWYRSEVFEKAGLWGALVMGAVTGIGGGLVINAMVGRGQPRRFVKWIQETDQAPDEKGQ